MAINLQSVPKLQGASVTKTINEPYYANFSAYPYILRQMGLTLNASTIYEHDNVYYIQMVQTRTDDKQAVISISLVDLLHTQLENRIVSDIEYTGNAAGIIAQMFNGTSFNVGSVSSSETRTFKVSSGNRASMLKEICRQYDLEIEHNGYIINFLTPEQNTITPATDIFKDKRGVNIKFLSCNEDVSNVLTHLYWRDATVKNSEYAWLVAANANQYQRRDEKRDFKGDGANKAARYLALKNRPNVSYTVTASPKIPRLQLGQMCNIHCDSLGIDVSLKVVSLTRSLTDPNVRKGGIDQHWDTYTIGTPQKEYIEKFSEYLGTISLPDLIIPTITQEIYDNFDYSQTNTSALLDIINPEAVKIIKADVISANVAQFMHVFANDMEIEMMETNQAMRNVRTNQAGTTRDFIRVQGQTVAGYRQILDLNNTEQKLTLDGQPVYYVDVGMNVADGSEIVGQVSNPFEFMTLTIPHTWNTTLMNLSDDPESDWYLGNYEDANGNSYTSIQDARDAYDEAHRVMVYKVAAEYLRYKITFNEQGEVDWQFGIGDASGNGVGHIRKNNDGLHLAYTRRTGGDAGEVSIDFTDNGIFAVQPTGGPFLIGSGEGGNFHIIDREPTEEDIEAVGENGLIIRYRTEDGGDVFGRSAYETAQTAQTPYEGGYSEFAQSLASIGDIRAALENILTG
ncbi:hypothetical protein FACS1894188_10950 [Clostridia bacterium]|nr:hypothetical protein FACS1894188_10950 [Clostridia bacterium]